MTNPEGSLTWLGAAFELMAPGWQGSFRVATGGETKTVVVALGGPETAAICAHLSQSKLDKRQAELILQHGGRELIEAALQAFELPDEVRIDAHAATLADDLRRWRVAR